MALGANTVWELNASSTASNVNGGGFNRSNANFLTDFTTDTNTGNTSAPVISSASYNFVAGDVGAYAWIISGTNWNSISAFPITSVATNKATLNAAVGAGFTFDTATNTYKPNTVAGVSSVGTPTGGTIGFDFSLQTAAEINGLTDITQTAASTTATSASAPFRRIMSGNILHATALTGTGAIVGWYEIATYTDTSNVVLDRTMTNGVNNITAGTFYVGGSMSMNSTLDDDFMEILIAGNFVYIKNGTFSVGEAISVGTAAGTQGANINLIGYNTVRGDNPSGSNRPVFNAGANAIALGARFNVFNVKFYGTAATLFTNGAGGFIVNCDFYNRSSTAARVAFSGSTGYVVDSEFVSYRGYGTSSAGGVLRFKNCYFHDSDVGFRKTNSDTAMAQIDECIFEGFTTAALAWSGTPTGMIYIIKNTIYGYANTSGTGISLGNAGTATIENNIITGFATGVSVSAETENYDDYNNYYNNDTDVTNWYKGRNSIALNPSFTNVSQVTGTAGAFVAGNNKLVDTTKNFTSLGVVAGDSVLITGGTGAPSPSYPYLIDSISTTTNANDTLNITIPAGPGTDTTTDKVYQITIGHNFAVGTNMKAVGFPGAFTGSNSTGYTDIGAVQRQEQASGGSGGFIIL